MYIVFLGAIQSPLCIDERAALLSLKAPDDANAKVVPASARSDTLIGDASANYVLLRGHIGP